MMPGLNFLDQYRDDQCRLFLEKLAIIRKRPAKDAVHDIRVAVKKLNSILQLIGILGPGGEGKVAFKPVKVFFRTAGIYRDAELNLALIRSISRQQQILLPSFQSHLQSIRSVAKTNTQLAAQEPLETSLADITRIINTTLDSCTDEQLKQLVEEKAYKKEAEVLTLVADLENQAHQVRKELKQLYYWLGPCPLNTLFDEKSMRLLKRALDALGHWHDHDVLHARLKKFRKNYLAKGTDEYIQTVKLEQVTTLLRKEWLSGAGSRIKKLLGA